MARHGISGDEVKKRLQSFRADLSEYIEPHYGLLDRLVSTGVLIMRENSRIRSKEPDSYRQCDVLLSIMRRKTPEQCEQFLDALKSTGQEHVVNFIVQKARRFNSYHNDWPLEDIHKEKIVSNFDRLVDAIDCTNTTLIDTLVSCHCINDQQSQSIRAAPTSVDMTRKLLTMLLRRSIKDYNEFVECLEESGMQHVVQEFHLDIGPISSSEPSGPGGNVTSSDVSDTHNPVPFSSSLAVSSSSPSAAPLKSLQTTTVPQPSSQSDVMTLKTTKRRMKGKLLFSLKRPPTDSIDNPRVVTGVAIVGMSVYVVYQGHENIYKYDEIETTDVIEVKGMISPNDMVADSEKGMLFVCDSKCDVIWRVSLDTREIIKSAKLRTRSWCLSLFYTHLLVTSSNSLMVLDFSTGEVIQKIPLPLDTYKEPVMHSIESGRGTLIVCYHRTVIEMDFEGRVIQEFNCEEQRLYCNHLALDSVGHRLFVADCITKQMFVINEQLKFQRILVNPKQLDNERPRRLNYDKKNNRLAVGLDNGHVKIFEC